MEFRILGPLEVLHDGEPVPLGGPRDRALLALLITRVGEVVSSHRLIDALWGDDLPKDPEHALQAAVSRLRRALRVDPGLRNVLVRRFAHEITYGRSHRSAQNPGHPEGKTTPEEVAAVQFPSTNGINGCRAVGLADHRGGQVAVGRSKLLEPGGEGRTEEENGDC